jgi:carboxypeptidase C (cathepsin A)
MNRRSRAALAAVVVLAFMTVAGAEDVNVVTTRHQIRLNGQMLNYVARAGLLPIRNNDAGEIHGNMFFVAYSLPSPPDKPRPVTFVWNGGPGANSVFVHLFGFGPRRMHGADDPATSGPAGSALEDNEATWLDVTDLVFVDPIGTGFSRPTRSQFAGEFLSTLGDIASVAEFVRVFCTHFDRMNAPIFLAGESYGTWRASGVAETLARRGLPVAGVILISGGIQMGPVLSDAERTALFVPSRTAAAFYHKRLAPDLMADEKKTLAEARRWALTEYARSWERRDDLSEAERDRIVTQLARYTGVDPETIDRKALAMTSPQFTAALLRDQKLTLGRYDMRLTHQQDPADAATRAPIVTRYLRNDLGFKDDLAYQGLEIGYSSQSQAPTDSVGARWEWNQGEASASPAEAAHSRLASSTVGSGDGPPGGSQPWLRRAMLRNPALKVFVAAGRYDSLNSCDDNEALVGQLELQFRGNFTTGCYLGGHMMYDVRATRLKLKTDIAKFIRGR